MKERLADVLNLEVASLVTLFWMFTYFFYLIFLRSLNPERHGRMKSLFKESLITFVVFALFYGAHDLLENQFHYPTAEVYVGVATLLMGALFFVRSCKILVFEYLFLSNKREGVPVLLVDMVTLVISIFLGAWIMTSIFGVRIAPLLATSALLSVVLGLALQDTLGNLFAGVALQFDKPYEIGDWIEIHSESKTYVGKVNEINWRATTLFGFFDEVHIIPNRLISQSEVTNFSGRTKPVYQGFSIHLDPGAEEIKVRAIFDGALKSVAGIVPDLPKYVMLRELNEKGAHWRVAYPIEDYAYQFVIVNDILKQVQGEFKKENIVLGRFRVDAVNETRPSARA